MKLIEDLGMVYMKDTSKHKRRVGIYECPICKNNSRFMTHNVTRGRTTSCRSCSTTKHGLSRHKLYNRWSLMMNRCNNETDCNYYAYGAVGIKVSDELSDIGRYITHVESLPDAHKQGRTVDRINNLSGYTVGNLRWAKLNVQARNTKLLAKNNTSGYRGVAKSLNKWRAIIKVNSKKINIGTFEYKWSAAYAYDSYVIINNLEHTRNF